MEYPIEIEYLKSSEPPSLTSSRGSLVTPSTKLSPMTLRAEFRCTFAKSTTQSASNCVPTDSTTSAPTPQSHYVVAKTKPDDNEIQLYSAIQLYIEVWNSLVVENGLLRHVNGNRHSSCIAVPPNLREGVVSALHLPAYHGFESTLRRVAQRVWWPRVRGHVSTYVRNCEVYDHDKNSNPNPRAALGRLPTDQPFASLYVDIVGG